MKKRLAFKKCFDTGMDFEYQEVLDEETNIVTMKAVMKIDLNSKKQAKLYDKQQDKSTYMMWKYLRKIHNSVNCIVLQAQLLLERS